MSSCCDFVLGTSMAREDPGHHGVWVACSALGSAARGTPSATLCHPAGDSSCPLLTFQESASPLWGHRAGGVPLWDQSLGDCSLLCGGLPGLSGPGLSPGQSAPSSQVGKGAEDRHWVPGLRLPGSASPAPLTHLEGGADFPPALR